MAMKDLKISKKEAKSKNEAMVIGSADQERYPYGLRLELNNDTLDKLGIDKMFSVGTVLMFEVKAKVIGSRQSATEGSENRSIELQVTHIDMENAKEEKAEGELSRAKGGAASNVAKKIASM